MALARQHTKTGILAILRCSEFRQHNVYPQQIQEYTEQYSTGQLISTITEPGHIFLYNGDHRATLLPRQQTDKCDAWSSDAKCPILYRITNDTIATSKHLN